MSYNNLRRGRYSEEGREYLITAVAAQREPLFKDFAGARCVVAEMRRLHESGAVNSLAWVLMPDHLHWLFALGSHSTLAQAMRRFKGRSARALNRLLARSGPVWQAAYHDHALRSEEDRRDIARYIVANPLRAGLVKRLADYPHWDAAWLDVSA